MRKTIAIVAIALGVIATVLVVSQLRDSSNLRNSHAKRESWHQMLLGARLDCEDLEKKSHKTKSCWDINGQKIPSNAFIRKCFSSLEVCTRRLFNKRRAAMGQPKPFNGHKPKTSLEMTNQLRIEGGDSRPWLVIEKDCVNDCEKFEKKEMKSLGCWETDKMVAEPKMIRECYWEVIHCTKKCFNLAWKDKTKRKSKVFHV